MADPTGDRVGRQLGAYRLVRLLGRGGFAEVYMGEHIYLNSRTALKVLNTELNDRDIESFAKEAQTLARLTHPHILRVLDFAVENGIPFLVTEYAPNGTLRNRHPRGSRLPIETIVPYVQQVASALQYAHDNQVIHRDVKPENMLLGSHGEVLLADFGTALFTPHTHSFSTVEMQESLAGTVSYAAPEQLQGNSRPESDQYSLGVVVYEWLCGRLPFPGSFIQMITQHLSTPPPSLREQVPGLSSDIEEVAFKALAKDPQQRFARVQDFAIALEQASRSIPLSIAAAQPSIQEPARSFGNQALQTPVKPGPIWKVPTTFTPLIGREQDAAKICTRLKKSDVRLLTLLGIGGIGKSRLAIQVAQEIREHFADGVCFIALAVISDPQLVVPNIAQELGIREVGEQLFEQMKFALRDKHLLLVLDNFEHVMTAVSQVEELLAACPLVKVIVTSREVLNIPAEHIFHVPPLTLPNLKRLPESEVLSQYAAVALFVQRAQAILPTFQITPANARSIAKICVRLDGLPLAIEFAAARIRLLPPQALLAQLSLQLLSDGPRTAPKRQRTLRNTLKWSYDLLDAQEQQLFRRLSVFVGGWTLEAVEAVWNAERGAAHPTLSALDGVASLLKKSLLLQLEEEGEEPHLIMLMIVREYAQELLQESGEAELIQRAHAQHYLSFVEEAEPYLKGEQQIVWLARLEREQENLWAALEWLIEHEEAELALRFCGALWRFWYLSGYWGEGRRWLAKALGMRQAQAPTVARARALCSAGDLAYYQDDYAVARSLLEESVALCRQLGTQRELASALGILGILIHMQGNSAAAHPLLEESITLCRRLNSKWELSYLLRRLGQRVLQEGDQDRATTFMREALTLAQELGDRYLIATTLLALSQITQIQGDLAQTTAYVQESLPPAQELKDKYLIAIALHSLGYLQMLQADLSQAEVSAQKSLAVIREVGDKMFLTHALHTLGYLATLQHKLEQATAYYREGFSLAQEIGNETRVGWYLNGLAGVAAAEERPVRAAHLLGAAEKRLDVKVAMNAAERADYERLVEKVRTQLGEEAFSAAWAAGQAMTPEQVLSVPEPLPAPKTPVPLEPPPTPVAATEPQPARTGRSAHPVKLTTREMEVLRQLAQGLTDAAIAERLVISERTVGKHLENIFQKIAVNTRGAAIRYAIDNGLV